MGEIPVVLTVEKSCICSTLFSVGGGGGGGGGGRGREEGWGVLVYY